MGHQYHVLTGPTAAGKTALLLRMAERGGVLVISADSRQVYRHMDIGTGKSTAAEQQVLPHRVIDVADPGEDFSAFHFIQHAAAALAEARHAGLTAWICGGTGLYIRALTERLPFGAAPRPRLRAALTQALQSASAAQLAAELGLELAEQDNPARVIRAAENACQDPDRSASLYQRLGLPPEDVGDDDRSAAGQKLPAEVLAELDRWQCAGVHVLDPGKDELAGRIERRVQAMFDDGLVQEVERLRQLGFGGADVVMQGIGYQEAGAVLDGQLTVEEAVDQAIVRTRQYAKRQRTYFRGQGWTEANEQDILLATVRNPAD